MENDCALLEKLFKRENKIQFSSFCGLLYAAKR